VYSQPDDGDRWLWFQDKLRAQHPGQSPVVAAVQLYSDKTLLNMKGLTAHPIR